MTTTTDLEPAPVAPGAGPPPPDGGSTAAADTAAAAMAAVPATEPEALAALDPTAGPGHPAGHPAAVEPGAEAGEMPGYPCDNPACCPDGQPAGLAGQPAVPPGEPGAEPPVRQRVGLDVVYVPDGAAELTLTTPGPADLAPVVAGNAPAAPGYGDPGVHVASPSIMARWLADAGSVAGEPISMSVTGYVREVRVNLPTAAAFRAWCSYLRVGQATVTRDRFGSLAEAVIDTHGWRFTLGLYGDAVEGLR